MHFETVCLMLVLAALENWYITGLDVQSAYLYGKLNEEIYMEQPEGFAVPRQEHKVLHLWRALYGLKQAGLAWWCTLNESLKELGFECLKSEAGIFFYKKKGTNIVIGIIYIDDCQNQFLRQTPTWAEISTKGCRRQAEEKQRC